MTLTSLRTSFALVLGSIGAGTTVVAYIMSVVGGISRGDLFLPYSVAAALVLLALIAKPRPVGRWGYAQLCAAAVFYGAFVAGWILPAPRLVELSMALAAAVMLVCLAYGTHRHEAGAAWRAEETPSLVIVAGLYEGLGAVSILTAAVPTIIRAGLPAGAVAMVLALMLAYRWHEMAERAGTGALGEEARAAIDRASPWVLWVGCLLPFIVYGVVLFVGEPWAAAAAGAASIVGGVMWKGRLLTPL